jgi:hypothetical protein
MEVPIVNEFDSNLGKFIQVYVKDKPYFRFSSGSLLHGHAFKDLLDSLEIDYETFEEDFNDIKGNHSIIKIPKREGKNYELVGAGTFRRMGPKHNLSDKSGSYWIGPNKEHAEEISKLTGLEFIIE